MKICIQIAGFEMTVSFQKVFTRSQKSFKMKKKAYWMEESQALGHSNREMFWSENTCSVT